MGAGKKKKHQVIAVAPALVDEPTAQVVTVVCPLCHGAGPADCLVCSGAGTIDAVVAVALTAPAIVVREPAPVASPVPAADVTMYTLEEIAAGLESYSGFWSTGVGIGVTENGNPVYVSVTAGPVSGWWDVNLYELGQGDTDGNLLTKVITNDAIDLPGAVNGLITLWRCDGCGQFRAPGHPHTCSTSADQLSAATPAPPALPLPAAYEFPDLTIIGDHFSSYEIWEAEVGTFVGGDGAKLVIELTGSEEFTLEEDDQNTYTATLYNTSEDPPIAIISETFTGTKYDTPELIAAEWAHATLVQWRCSGCGQYRNPAGQHTCLGPTTTEPAPTATVSTPDAVPELPDAAVIAKAVTQAGFWQLEIGPVDDLVDYAAVSVQSLDGGYWVEIIGLDGSLNGEPSLAGKYAPTVDALIATMNDLITQCRCPVCGQYSAVNAAHVCPVAFDPTEHEAPAPNPILSLPAHDLNTPTPAQPAPPASAVLLPPYDTVALEVSDDLVWKSSLGHFANGDEFSVVITQDNLEGEPDAYSVSLLAGGVAFEQRGPFEDIGPAYAAANTAAGQWRCAECGQFRSPNAWWHTCPTTTPNLGVPAPVINAITTTDPELDGGLWVSDALWPLPDDEGSIVVSIQAYDVDGDGNYTYTVSLALDDETVPLDEATVYASGAADSLEAALSTANELITTWHCSTCGQFRSPYTTHTCPTPTTAPATEAKPEKYTTEAVQAAIDQFGVWGTGVLGTIHETNEPIYISITPAGDEYGEGNTLYTATLFSGIETSASAATLVDGAWGVSLAGAVTWANTVAKQWRCPTCGQFRNPDHPHTCPTSTADTATAPQDIASKFAMALDAIHTLDPAEDYTAQVEAFNKNTDLVKQVQAMLSEPDVASDQDKAAAMFQMLVNANAEYLAGVPDDMLAPLAQQFGLEHAALVSPESTRFYLNRAYWSPSSDDADTLVAGNAQLGVVLAAQSRYAELQSGKEVNGFTLDGYNALQEGWVNAGWAPNPTSTAGTYSLAPVGSWFATPESFNDAMNALKELEKTVNYNSDPAQFRELAEAYRKALTAKADPTLVGASETQAMLLKKQKELAAASAYCPTFWDSDRLTAYLTGLDIAENDIPYISAKEAVVLLTSEHGIAEWTTSPQSINEAISARKRYFAALNDAVVHIPDNTGPISAFSVEEVSQAVYGLGLVTQAPKQAHRVAAWMDQPAVVKNNYDLSKYQTAVRSWAKAHNMDDLRAAATSLGLEHAEIANRSQLTGYLSSHMLMHSTKAQHSPAEWQTQINEAWAAKTGASSPSSSTSAAISHGTPQPTVPAPTPDTGTTSAQQGAQQAAAQQIAASLAMHAVHKNENVAAGLTAANVLAGRVKKKAGVPDLAPKAPESFTARTQLSKAWVEHTKASFDPIPAALTAAEVANIPFTQAPNQSLGGAHTKDFLLAPDGTTWMRKPYSNSPGGAPARCASEAAASSLLRAGGIPAVPVYNVAIKGKSGAVQPLIANTGTLNAHPSTFSQADVDSIVRMHVGAWVVGDHDMHTANILRTPSGGLVPIDQGQAFKHYGTDKLDIDYHPNASFGQTPPAWQGVYKAAQSSSLAPSVRVRPEIALATIQEYEKIPDSEWRAALSDVASLGSKDATTAWRQPMRERAAATLNKPVKQVTDTETANAFLDYAVERKNTLRATFMEFFVREGWTQAKHLFTVT